MNEHLSIRTAGTVDLSHERSRRWGEFLRRQFRDEPTHGQVIFDIIVGIVLPILCLVFDPLVFRGGISGRPLAGEFQLFAYALIAIEIAALAVWLGIGSRTGEWRGVLGGIMLSGALFSAGIGICLLPFSLIGLLFIIGALGFTPFLTAFIYLRNARRALRAGGTQLTRAGLSVTLLFGVTLALGAPAFAHWRVTRLIERSLAEVLEGEDARTHAAARKLRRVSWLASGELDQVVWAYGRETDPRRKDRLARAYRDITGGGDIEHRLAVLYD
jgi:hypothetical protein